MDLIESENYDLLLKVSQPTFNNDCIHPAVFVTVACLTVKC